MTKMEDQQEVFSKQLYFNQILLPVILQMSGDFLAYFLLIFLIHYLPAMGLVRQKLHTVPLKR